MGYTRGGVYALDRPDLGDAFRADLQKLLSVVAEARRQTPEIRNRKPECHLASALIKMCGLEATVPRNKRWPPTRR